MASHSADAMNSRGRVLVLGAYGYLGTILSPVIAQSGFELVRQGRAEDAELTLDPTDARALDEAVASVRPQFVVNLVAATNVDECERDPRLAQRVNVGVVGNIANAISDSGIRLVQISTDQVYTGAGPHSEDDVDPVNVYARTKLLGEQEAEAVGALVLRINIVGPSMCADRVSFSDWLIGQLQAQQPLTLFTDVLFSPLEALDLASLIAQAIDSKLSGVFNLGSRDGLSKADFGLGLAAELGLGKANIRLGSVADAGLKAPRPADMRMNCNRFENQAGIELSTIAETIRRTALRHSAELKRD